MKTLSGYLALLLIALLSSPLHAQSKAKPPTGKLAAKLDLYGDPLPKGAIARLGTVRLRHHDWTWSVAISPDGKTMVSGSTLFLKLWDTSTGKSKGELPGGANAIVFSKDGKQLLTFGEALPTHGSRVIRLWDFKNKKVLWAIDTENSSPKMGPNVRTLAFHPDGKRIVAHLTNGSVFLLNRNTGEIEEYSSTEKTFLGGRSFFSLSPNGKKAAIGEMNIIRLVSIPETGRQFEKESKTEILKVSNGKVTALRYLSEELLLVAVHDEVLQRHAKGYPERVKNDVSIEIWNVRNRKQIGKLSVSKNREAVAAMTPTSDGKTLYVSHQKWIDTWDLEKRKRTSELSQLPHLNRGMINANLLALSKDEKLLASAGSPRVIQLWKLPERKSVLPDKIGHHDVAKSIAWTPDGRYLVSGSHDGTVRFWEPSTGKEVKRFDYWNRRSPINDIAISHDGRKLAAVGTAAWKKPVELWGSVMIWDIESGKVIREIRHAQLSKCVAISPNGSLIAFDSPNPFARPRSNTVYVYEIATGKELHQFDMGSGSVRGLGFSQDSQTLIATSRNFGIFRWNMRSGKAKKSIVGQNSVGAASFAMNCEKVAIFGSLQSGSGIRVHNLVSGKEKNFPMLFQPGQRFSRSFSYTSISRLGGLVALKKGEFGTFGNGVSVVDTLTGKTVFSTGPVDLVTDVSLTPDGRKLATVFHNGTILIWQVYRKLPETKIETGSSDLKKDWELLSSADMPKVWETIDRMSSQPSKTIDFLKVALLSKPTRKLPPKDTKKLIDELESESFAKRRQAFSKLKSYGTLIANELQQAATDTKSSEAKNRLLQLIQATKELIQSTEIHHLRGIQILERIGPEKAKPLIEKLAAGEPNSIQTIEAQRILSRWKKQK